MGPHACVWYVFAILSTFATSANPPGGLLVASLALFAVCVGLMFTPIIFFRPGKVAILYVSFPLFAPDQFEYALQPRGRVQVIQGLATLARPRTIMHRLSGIWHTRCGRDAPLSSAGGGRGCQGVPLMITLATRGSAVDPLHRPCHAGASTARCGTAYSIPTSCRKPTLIMSFTDGPWAAYSSWPRSPL
jgi:hypothetical protein